jgi:hypothetical protein
MVSSALDAQNPDSGGTITDDFQEIAVRIEEIHAIVIAPIDIPGAFDPSLREAITRRLEIRPADAKRMMPPAQRMPDALPPLARWKCLAWNVEQREVLIAALQQRLIAQMRNDAQTQHFCVKALGARQVRDLDSKMVEPFKLHRKLSPR